MGIFLLTAYIEPEFLSFGFNERNVNPSSFKYEHICSGPLKCHSINTTLKWCRILDFPKESKISYSEP